MTESKNQNRLYKAIENSRLPTSYIAELFHVGYRTLNAWKYGEYPAPIEKELLILKYLEDIEKLNKKYKEE